MRTKSNDTLASDSGFSSKIRNVLDFLVFLLEWIVPRGVKPLASLDRLRRIKIYKYISDVRLDIFELVAEEINSKKIPGSVAELGVYKGKFSKYINELFPDRTLYLFDTFEGFDKRDVIVEIRNKYSSGNQDFTRVNLDQVLQKMKHPEKCVIKKGHFPESLDGLEDEFCFVSLDADLFQPMLEGLKYFYPRLVRGGYIFVHDFNNRDYRGVKKAVQEFCREREINYLPIPDTKGTVVIMK